MSNLNVVKEFIELAKAGGVSELKFENETIKLEVSFNTGHAQIVSSPSVMMTHSAPAVTQVTKSESSVKEISKETAHLITSPLVGTFYAAPGPGKPNYAKVGDKVKKGQTLCILEAMKIMNEIESDTDGEIIEICIESESLVEYGQVLFKIRK
jgi:acetyl-CoA carboxylase biotin carboxyl carrier protein